MGRIIALERPDSNSSIQKLSLKSPAVHATTHCPSCQVAMEVHHLPSVRGGDVALDLCFHCRGIWFDPQENLRLTPASVLALFRLLHDHRDDARTPMATRLGCPRCRSALTQGFDVVKSGRYITFRCVSLHGRFSPFSSFMVEKGFVRHLTQPEIDDIAQRVAVINCTGCGAPVDVRKDHACQHCRSALSLLDPQAVAKAMKGYATAVAGPAGLRMPELADAIVMVERDRLSALEETKKRRGSLFSNDAPAGVDLWAVGIAMVWKMLD
jgi:Zn-finger nucleic acid-binding protein